MARCKVTITGTPLEHLRVGSTLLTSARFTALDTGLGVVPSAVALVARNGADGTVVTVTTVQTGVGSYQGELALDSPGAWYLRWSASGTYVGAAEDQVIASPSRFP